MCDMADGAAWRARLVVLLAVAALGLSGCGSASEPSPPSGVDGLVIPTPSIDPEDFVAEVDNRWYPLAPGSRWTYEATGEAAGTVVVEVSDQPWRVAGVDATVVHTTFEDHSSTDFYAQDRAGNVWWLGREGVFEAGVDGAEAGLAMAANPRVGDGYRMADVDGDGVAEDQALVRSVDTAVTVPAGSFEGCVEIETSSSLEPGVRGLRTYAEGVGLVRAVSVEGSDLVMELVEGP